MWLEGWYPYTIRCTDANKNVVMLVQQTKDWLKRQTDLSDIAYQVAKGADLHPHLREHYIEELIEAKNRKLISLTPQMMLEVYKIELEQRIYHKNPQKIHKISS